MKEARLAWFDAQPDLDPERLVFLDETAAATNMMRRHARSRRGRRCRIAVPHGHYKTTTVTAALRGSGPFAIDLMDGATNGVRFRAYVTDTLVPALKPSDTVPRQSPPSRAALRQAEGAAAFSRGAHRPRSVGDDPRGVYPLQTGRMPQLSRSVRLRCI